MGGFSLCELGIACADIILDETAYGYVKDTIDLVIWGLEDIYYQSNLQREPPP